MPHDRKQYRRSEDVRYSASGKYDEGKKTYQEDTGDDAADL